MERIDVTLKLPEEIANRAQAAGLLSEERLTALLVAELERESRVERFFNSIKKIHAVQPTLTQEEIDAEIEAYREEVYSRQGNE